MPKKNGYLVQIWPTSNDEEVALYLKGILNPPLYYILKSIISSDNELNRNFTFKKYYIFSSHLKSTIDGTYPFWEQIKFFLNAKPYFIGFSSYTWSFHWSGMKMTEESYSDMPTLNVPATVYCF